jgi:hypothetical protein
MRTFEIDCESTDVVLSVNAVFTAKVVKGFEITNDDERNADCQPITVANLLLTVHPYRH